VTRRPTEPFRLHREQLVPRPIHEVFEFFSRAENLQAITPEWLNFEILVNPPPVRKGTLIDYKLRLHGLPLRWQSEVVEWDPPHTFVDVQVRGPYKLWHHTHRFVAEGNSTRIVDEVRYQLPFGMLGALAHRLMVRRDVEKIFSFRQQKIASLFR
jgi:ligand-binding SRPBCC domain-containing protein